MVSIGVMDLMMIMKDYSVKLIIVFAFIVFDIISGLFKAFANEGYNSSKMRQGLTHKMGELFCFLFCVLCDLTLPRLDILLPFSITSGVTVYLVFMEIGSIIENVGLLNPEIGKYLTGIFEKIKEKHEDE